MSHEIQGVLGRDRVAAVNIKCTDFGLLRCQTHDHLDDLSNCKDRNIVLRARGIVCHENMSTGSTASI